MPDESNASAKLEETQPTISPAEIYEAKKQIAKLRGLYAKAPRIKPSQAWVPAYCEAWFVECRVLCGILGDYSKTKPLVNDLLGQLDKTCNMKSRARILADLIGIENLLNLA